MANESYVGLKKEDDKSKEGAYIKYQIMQLTILFALISVIFSYGIKKHENNTRISIPSL